MKKSNEHIGVLIILGISFFLLTLMLGSFFLEYRNEQQTSQLAQQEQEDLVLSVAANASRRGNVVDGLTIVEFGDFSCAHCKEFSSTMKQLLAKYPNDIQHIWFHALSTENELGLTAATASECAKQQGAFWEFHDELFALPEITLVAINQLVAELNLDRTQFQSCLENRSTREIVFDHINFSEFNGVAETPTLLINNERIEGLQSFEEVDRIIIQQLANN